MNSERLLDALADVGDDLIAMAEHKRFASHWRQWGQMAAVLAVVCLGALALPHFIHGANETARVTMESAVEETEECVVEESAAYEEGSDECMEETPCECISDESIAPEMSPSDGIEESVCVTLEEVRRAVEEEDHVWLAETFVQPVEESRVKVCEAVTEEDWLYLLISLPDEKGVTKEYIIRFGENGWYHETINELMPDGTPQGGTDAVYP